MESRRPAEDAIFGSSCFGCGAFGGAIGRRIFQEARLRRRCIFQVSRAMNFISFCEVFSMVSREMLDTCKTLHMYNNLRIIWKKQISYIIDCSEKFDVFAI